MKGGKIAILKWESGFVPMGLMQLESLTGNSTNIDSYPFDVKFQEIEGANIETILLNPSQVILNRMIDVSKEMIKNEGVNVISTSCGFNAIFQKQLAKELTVPVFSSALLQVPMVCNMIGTDKTVGIITANKESLTKEHLSECGVTDEMNYVVKGLEDYHEWSKIFNNPNEKFNMEVVKNEILDAAKNLYESNPELGAIVLECTDLPPFADFIREETGLPVFDFNSLAVYVALGVGAFKAY